MTEPQPDAQYPADEDNPADEAMRTALEDEARSARTRPQSDDEE